MHILYGSKDVSIIIFDCSNKIKNEFLIYDNRYVDKTASHVLMQQAQYQVHVESEDKHEILFPIFVYELPYELKELFEKIGPRGKK